jgi:hypothetical protein
MAPGISKRVSIQTRDYHRLVGLEEGVIKADPMELEMPGQLRSAPI